MNDTAALITAIAGALAIVFGAFTGLRKSKSEDSAAFAAAAATRATTRAKMEEIVDARVLKSMERQDAEIENLSRDMKSGFTSRDDEIRELKAAVQRGQEENTRTKGTFRRFFYRLRDWETDGRPGPLPVPTDEEMILLEIDTSHDDTTLGREDAATVVREHRNNFADDY